MWARPGLSARARLFWMLSGAICTALGEYAYRKSINPFVFFPILFVVLAIIFFVVVIFSAVFAVLCSKPKDPAGP